MPLILLFLLVLLQLYGGRIKRFFLREGSEEDGRIIGTKRALLHNKGGNLFEVLASRQRKRSLDFVLFFPCQLPYVL